MVAASDQDPPLAHDPASPNRSTGPRTDAGKARSSMNAVTHGLTAKTPLLPGEDPDEFRLFVWDVIEDLSPQGVVQNELASRAAVLMWKRRRVAEAETQVVAELADQYTADAEDAHRQTGEQGPVDPARVARCIVADEFASKPDQLDRLERYEQRISQQIESTIRLLLKLQNRKDWQRQQGESRGEAGASRSDAAKGGPVGASSELPPPPPAPVQNERVENGAAAPETRPSPACRGAPGMN